MKALRVVFTTAALALSASAARAQDPAPAPPPEDVTAVAEVQAPAETPAPIEVVVVGDPIDALQKIPGSAAVIGPKEVARAKARDVAEVLRRVPGLYVREDTAGGTRLDIGVRGLDPGRSRRVLVLEDGVPLAVNPYAEPDLYFVPQIERVSSIEVLKGSGSILYGPQTLGGVINFRTFFPPSSLQSFASTEVGEHGFGRVVGRVGDSVGELRLLGQIAVKRDDGESGQGFSDADVMLKGAYPTSQRGEVLVKLAAHRGAADSEDVGLTQPMFEADPRRPSPSPFSRATLRRFDASVVHDYAFAEDVTLKVLVYGSYTDRLWGRQLYDRTPLVGRRYERIVGDATVAQGALYFRDEVRVLDRAYAMGGIEPRLSFRFTTWAFDHAADVGARVLVEGAWLDERAGASKTALGGPLVLDDRHTTFAIAAYVQDRVAVTHNVIVTPGVRIEHARYARTLVDSQSAASVPSGADDVLALVPGLGVTAGLPELNAFGGVHVGFAPPRLTSAINALGESQSLDPEESVNYELGARARFRRVFSLEATGFMNRFANQIVPNTAPGATTELRNGGQTTTLGVEGSAQAMLGKLFDLGLDLDVFARAGYLRATFDEGSLAGNLIPYAPSVTFSTGADVGLPMGLSAGFAFTYLGAHFTDDQNTLLPDVTGRVGRIDPAGILDATLRYLHEPTGIGASIGVKNLLDHTDVVSRRPEGIFIGSGRQAIAGVSWSLR